MYEKHNRDHCKFCALILSLLRRVLLADGKGHDTGHYTEYGREARSLTKLNNTARLLLLQV
ncbi:hypothetical protein FNW02_06265 [Komarekiella sp. 'clone 1']|uniref:Uncharacterized protein n=1 Tax=Komarekiella delphini-convector SJRDD-AB1 TaxID=2593771 RepID=A0AA40VQ77_9NOST|nr:hypothetical protein [Komarekiella delphini-convector SJRDD-AB1]